MSSSPDSRNPLPLRRRSADAVDDLREVSLRQPGFVERLQAAVAANPRRATDLEVEITGPGVDSPGEQEMPSGARESVARRLRR
jgi:hypothetical protein